MNNTIIIYIFLSFVILFVFAKISYRLNLIDLPNKRKIHTKATAYTGGIAISIIFLLSIILFDTFSESLSLILSIAFLISIVGLIDDIYSLNIGGKLSLQVIPIFFLVFFENLALTQIGSYIHFTINLGNFSIPFSILSILLLINAFNYFDGIDGMLGCLTISVLSILFFLTTQNSTHPLFKELNINIFIIALAIPIIIFLFFNFSFINLPKLFLGDSGSLLLGLIISFVLIYFANQNFIHPILLAWSVVIFVYEFLSINIIRIINKQKIFKAGQDHLHHIFLRKNKSIFLTNFLISLINISLFTIGYLSYLYINSLTSLIIFILLFIIFLFLRNLYTKKI